MEVSLYDLIQYKGIFSFKITLFKTLKILETMLPDFQNNSSYVVYANRNVVFNLQTHECWNFLRLDNKNHIATLL